MSPMPPWICSASSATMASISVALTLAMAMSMSVIDLLIALPGRLEHQEFGRPQFHRHVGELEAHALKLADLLAELHPVHGPLRR